MLITQFTHYINFTRWIENHFCLPKMATHPKTVWNPPNWHFTMRNNNSNSNKQLYFNIDTQPNNTNFIQEFVSDSSRVALITNEILAMLQKYLELQHIAITTITITTTNNKVNGNISMSMYLYFALTPVSQALRHGFGWTYHSHSSLNWIELNWIERSSVELL